MRTHRIFSFLGAVALCFALTLPALAQRGDDANRESKNGKTEGEVGGAAVVLEYGQPKVKSRTVWDGLVPYGKVWRTGADEATTVTFDKDVTVEGEKLAAGTYGLFTIPTEGEWTVIFNKTATQWGAFEYDKGQDALRVTVQPRVAEHAEEMTFEIDGSQIVLRWEKLAVAFEVAAAP